MKKYICKSNFVTGPKGAYTHHKRGEPFDCEDPERIADFLAQGLIMDKDEITVEELEALEKKIQAAKLELAALLEKSKILHQKLQNQEPKLEGEDSNGEEETHHDEFDVPKKKKKNR